VENGSQKRGVVRNRKETEDIWNVCFEVSTFTQYRTESVWERQDRNIL